MHYKDLFRLSFDRLIYLGISPSLFLFLLSSTSHLPSPPLPTSYCPSLPPISPLFPSSLPPPFPLSLPSAIISPCCSPHKLFPGQPHFPSSASSLHSSSVRNSFIPFFSFLLFLSYFWPPFLILPLFLVMMLLHLPSLLQIPSLAIMSYSSVFLFYQWLEPGSLPVFPLAIVALDSCTCWGVHIRGFSQWQTKPHVCVKNTHACLWIFRRLYCRMYSTRRMSYGQCTLGCDSWWAHVILS